MMRWKYALAVILVLPLAALADGLRNRGCNDCGGSGGGGHGRLFGNHGCANCGHGYGQGAGQGTGKGKGFGFFQPPFQAAPWYLYYPYDQHFQLPAPINAPYMAPTAYGAFNPYFAPANPWGGYHDHGHGHGHPAPPAGGPAPRK